MKKFFNLKNKYKRTISFLSIFVFSFTIFSIPFLEIQGALNKEINYQGKLTLSSGVAVSNATYNMEFKLYTTSTGGSAIWTETRTGGDRVNVSNGLFSVMLGEVTTLAGVDFNQTLYLGVTVGGSTVTPSWDSEMTPRKKIGVVPGAIMAETVTGASQSAITSLGDLTGLTVTGISNLRGILADNGTVTNDRIGISIASVGANRFDGTITNLDLTVNRTWSLPNNSGTIALTTDIPAQVYPGAGIPNSTGSAWGTSYTTTGSGTVLALATSPSFTTPSLGVATATSIDLTAGNLDVNNTTYASQTGVITKNGTRFLHDFNYGNNGTVTTVGANVFLGINSGNFTMGSTATSQYQASYNTGVGNGTLNALTTGSRNTVIGYRAGDLINSGTQNTAVGYFAMSETTSGSSNSAFGTWAFIGNTEGNYNTAIGYQAGRFIAGGSTANTTSDYGVYLGVNAKAGADNNQNEIVIGYDATGNGSNTATIGNISLLRTYLTGVNLKAGTATAGTAPLKLTAGTNLTTTEAGAIEYDGTHLYFTATNGGTRYQLDQQAGGVNWDAIGDPSGNGSIAMGSTVQTMDWATATTQNALSLTGGALTTGKLLSLSSNTLTSGILLDITSNGTAALTNQRGLNIALSGTNAASGQTTYGAYISNAHAGTTSTNVGLYASATGGTTANYAAIFANGNVGIGTTTPTARLHLPAGTATAGTAPLKLTAGTNLTTAETGAMEYDGTNLYFTPSGTTRRTIAYTSDLSSGYVPYSGATTNVNLGIRDLYAGEIILSDDNADAIISNPNAGVLIEYLDSSGTFHIADGRINVLTNNIGIGAVVGPTARFHLPAGTATAGTAPLKLTAGTNLTTTEAGAIEYDGTHLYFTATNGGTRYQLDQQASGGMVYPGAGIPNSTGSAWGTSYTTTGSGTVLALATTPTFTTNITTPLIIGGTTTTSPLTLRSTSGVGTTGADIVFQTGNDGATEAMRILNNGRVGIGTASPNSLFQVAGLISFDTAEYNTEIGRETGLNLVAGAQYNTFLGHQAGRGGNTGGTDAADNNTAIGYRAFYANTTGASNTAIGNYALTANTTGNSNSAIGTRALYSNTGGYNNTANGMYALYSNLTGNYNNANGQYSLYSNTTGGYNTAFGNYSLNANVAGSRATAFGYNAMRYANSSATPFFNYNLAIGYEALMGTTTSANNTGNHNTAIGYQSLSGYETASRNTAIGYFSGQSVLGGNNNLLLGYQVGDALTSGSNNIALGYDVDLPSATADNQMTIGNLIFASGGFGTGTTVGSGFIGIGKNNPAQRLDVSGNTAISGQTMLGLTSVSTSAQLSLSNTINTNGSSTAIAGIHGDYTFNNGGTAGYVQVGNRFVFNNAPTTNSNTMVGEIIRTIDNTSLANLVRGLDITSNAGSNTAGTNTGLRATGGTFGVQGITTGLAGGVSVPAALYGENTGATNGNILRLFSNSMTSAPSFATFYHDTSTFTGTGLLMDFATGSGTFSGNFVDFQRNNTTLFRVTNAGIVSLGLSSTASTTAVCSSLANGVSPTSGVSYELRDCSGSPVADYAEMYPVENGIEKGDIVATGNELINTYDTTNGEIDWNKIKGKVTKLIKSDQPYQKNIIGIVSDNYNDFSSTGYNIKENDNPIPVALSGRVPVKISLNSEPIKAGDYITTSSESGKATKATKAGFVIGKALEDWNNNSGKNTLMVFVEQGFYNGQSIDSFIGIEIESDENILENIFAKQVLNKLIENQENGEIISSEILTDRLVSGLEIITPEVTTNKLYVKNEIIIDGLSFFNGQSSFFDSVTFEKEVSFEVPPLFNKDTAGFALIKEDTKFVRINFENPYISNPVVTASISFEGEEGESEIDPDGFFSENIQYLINEKGPSGFTIVLNQEAPFDIRFSWIALSVKDPNIYESVIDGLIIERPEQDDYNSESENEEEIIEEEILSDEIKEEEINSALINEGEIDLNLDQEQDIEIEEVIIEEDVSDNQVQIEEDNPDISTEENSEAEGLSDNEII